MLLTVFCSMRSASHRIDKEMSSRCCSSCRTKYSLYNPEEGCSNCAFSFCRKCLPYRAILPHLADKPVSVCSQCFEKFNQETLRSQTNNDAQITRISIGDDSEPRHLADGIPASTNWWGDGLPPPSMRNKTVHPLPAAGRLHEISQKQSRGMENNVDNTSDLEARLMQSRECVRLTRPLAKKSTLRYRVERFYEKDGPEYRAAHRMKLSLPLLVKKSTEDVPSNVLTLSEIEERLAALRGCDVEVIRRPRCIFESAGKPRRVGGTVQELMKEARDLAEISDRHDPVNELERRHKLLREEREQSSYSAKIDDESTTTTTGSRPLSKVSTTTAFNETTAKELEAVNKLMEDAQKRVNASEADEKRMENEMKSVLAATRQKSLELEEVNKEIGQFWEKRLNEVSEDISESDDESVDDETVKKIILEAEQAVDESPSDQSSKTTLTPSNVKSSSPKRTGLFSKIFRK